MKKFKAIRKYTVDLVNPLEEGGKSYKVFKNLIKARAFGMQQRVQGNFISLSNFKRVLLPL